ncbi:MAG: DUF2505 domain-containing protein [Spongiibacteraceae bacterium]
MREKLILEYPEPADVVIKMYTDRDYFLTKYANLGATDISLIEESNEDGVFSIKVERTVPADVPLPSFAKKFFNGTMTIVQTDTWNTATKTGHLDIEFHGLSIHARSDMSLTNKGAGSILTMDWDIGVKIPLLGGKLEKVLMADTKKKVGLDIAEGCRLLASYK